MAIPKKTIIVFCPECNSEDIVYQSIFEGEDVIRNSMDDLGKPEEEDVNAIDEKFYMATCLSCGYKVTFTRTTRLGQIRRIKSELDAINERN